MLIGANIQRTQGYRLAVKHLQHALILGDLLLFGGEAALQHKRNFGAVKPDTIDKAAELLFMLRAQTGVEHHFYSLAAFQFGSAFEIVFRQPAQFVLFAD